MQQFNRKWNGAVEYIEKEVSNITEEVISIGQNRMFELLVVGKGTLAAKLADYQAEHPELGHMGDILASSDHGIVASVLVVQQHKLARANETIVSKFVGDKEAMMTDHESSA